MTPNAQTAVLRPEEAAKGSEVYELHRTLTRCQTVKNDAETRYLDVTREYEQHQRTIALARPGCDWTQIAAATAAVTHLRRYVDAAARDLRAAQDALLAAQKDFESTWRHYERVCSESDVERQLRVGGFVADAARDRERELARLVGRPTMERA